MIDTIVSIIGVIVGINGSAGIILGITDIMIDIVSTIMKTHACIPGMLTLAAVPHIVRT